MHVINNLILIWGLWTLQSGIEEKKFSDVCAGLFLIVMVFGFIIDSLQKDKELGRVGESFRMDATFYFLFAVLVAGRTAFYHLPFTFSVIFRCSTFAIAGLALIVLSPALLNNQVVFTKTGTATKTSRRFKLPESVVRLGLFAACLAIAAIATVLLVKDDKVRIACFLITMIVGLVATKILPMKALKWVLSSMSLGKLKADD